MMWNGPFGYADGWSGWGWLWPLHFIIPLLFLCLIVMGVMALMRYAMGWSGHHMGPGMMGRSRALDALEERYVRGEINRDEYLEKKKDVVG
jgi:putative membrane protein